MKKSYIFITVVIIISIITSNRLLAKDTLLPEINKVEDNNNFHQISDSTTLNFK